MELNLFCFLSFQLSVFKFPTNPGLSYQPGPEVWFSKNASKFKKEAEKKSRIVDVISVQRMAEKHTKERWQYRDGLLLLFNLLLFTLLSFYWCRKCWLGCCHSPTSSPGWLLKSWQIVHIVCKALFAPVRRTKFGVYKKFETFVISYFLDRLWDSRNFSYNQKRQLK